MPFRGRLPKGMSTKFDPTIELLDLWNRALDSPYGIRIRSEKQWYLVNLLYKARRECGHFNYGGLRLSFDAEWVYIGPRER